jgi:hypothetical protein
MTVAAPPQPPQVSEPARDDCGEALIKEAKQRARRRRWCYGVAVLVAIAAVVAFSIVAGGTPPPHRAARNVPTPPTPPIRLGAPLVAGADAGSTLLASWGSMLVYADGRVIWIGGDERHLSPGGLALVRAGRVALEDLSYSTQKGAFDRTRAEWHQVWAEPTARKYQPDKYAVCPNSFTPGQSIDPTRALGLYPAPAQARLAGKQRTFDPSIGVASESEPHQLMQCFEVTAAESSTLYQIFDANGSIYHGFSDDEGADSQWFAGFDKRATENNPQGPFLTASPIYPHGQPMGVFHG